MIGNVNIHLHISVVTLKEGDSLTYSEHYLPIGQSKTILLRQNTILHVLTSLSYIWEMTLTGPPHFVKWVGPVAQENLLKMPELTALQSGNKGF